MRDAPPISVRFEETDVPALLRASLAPLMEHAEAEGIELRVAAAGEVPPVAVDREKLAWCVATLVGNALRYVERANADAPGGSVLVHVEHVPGSPHVAIAVHDDGPGIPAAKLPYLFERREGALHAEGLALLLVREIVTAHGGRIVVESRTGLEEHGTSITLCLPSLK
jgi:signal transduction histidine kinase